MMFRKISLTMTFSYGLTIIATIVLLNVILAYTYQEKQTAKNEDRYVQFASIIANIAKDKLEGHYGIKRSRKGKQLEKLTVASEEILKWKLNTKVDVKRRDEIGKLAETFNKMSEELYNIDANRRRFISDVSHELKTPPASIKALIESLIYGDDDISTYKEYLGDINDEMDRLTFLSNPFSQLQGWKNLN